MRSLFLRVIMAAMTLLIVGSFTFAAAVTTSTPQALLKIEQALSEGTIDADAAALNTFWFMYDQTQMDPSFYVENDIRLKCGTHMLNEILNDEDVSARAKAVMNEYLHADADGGDTRDYYWSPGGVFRIEYWTTGIDAVHATDTNPANGIPDLVERCGEYLDYSWQTEITDTGFEAPVLTSGYYRIEMRNLSGIYGSTHPLGSGRTYIKLHRNFLGFPANDDPDGDQLGAAKVTCAHEFKHASQYATSAWSEGGWVELDATWAEEFVFPLTNDYHVYLIYGNSPLSRPFFSLDYSGDGGTGSYEDCIWQQMMSEKWGEQFIVELWELRDQYPSWPMMTSYDNKLQAYGSDVRSFMAEWTRWNYLSGVRGHDDWDGGPGEGGYPDSPEFNTAAAYNSGGLGNPQSQNVPHLATRYYHHHTVSGIAGYPKVVFDGHDDADFRPQVIINKLDGTLVFTEIEVDANCDGELIMTVPFSQIYTIGLSFVNCETAGGSIQRAFSYQMFAEDDPSSAPDAVPGVMALHPNYPNPFNPTTTVSFDLHREANVTLQVIAPMGRVVRTLIDGETMNAATHNVTFDGKDDAGNALASGVYFTQLSVGGAESQLAKMTLLK